MDVDIFDVVGNEVVMFCGGHRADSPMGQLYFLYVFGVKRAVFKGFV